MKKGYKISISIVASLVVLLLLFVAVYYAWPWNKSFFDNARQEFVIPGLDTKFTPQGMANINGTNKYLISGYMTDGNPSRIYLINDGNVEKFFTLKYEIDQDEYIDYVGHAGGIETTGNTIWLVGDKLCYTFRMSDVTNVSNGGSVNAISQFEPHNGADFVFANNNTLWIGEFYKKDKYETLASHHLKTPSGQINHSLVFGFTIDESKDNGVVSTIPVKALSITDECQGIDISSDGKIIMSCSYGIYDSRLNLYETLDITPHDEFIMGNHVIDLWYLDSDNLINTIYVPSMSEELIVKEDIVYILFESGAKKYKIFNRKQLKNVYSIAIDSLIN